VHVYAQGLLGRLAGALKYMSPWKPRTDPEDDNVPVDYLEDEGDQIEEDGDDDQGYGDHQGAGSGQEHGLFKFAKTLPNKVDRPHNGHDQLDESTEISTADTSHDRYPLQSSGLIGREGGVLSMSDLGGGASRGYGGSGGSFGASGFGASGFGASGFAGSGGSSRGVGGGDGGSNSAGMSRSANEEGDVAVKLMVRPRGVRKELMMPLRVAQTVARMGKENFQHKRALAVKFASQEMKAYMVCSNVCQPASGCSLENSNEFSFPPPSPLYPHPPARVARKRNKEI